MRFQRLFAKIFLWFWLALILVASAAVMVTSWIRANLEPPNDHTRTLARFTQHVPAETAVDVFEQFGPGRLMDHLAMSRRHAGQEAFLLDERNHELTGRRLPPPAIALADRARHSGVAEVDRVDRARFVAVPVKGQRGAYTYVAELPPGPPIGPWRDRTPGPPPMPFGFLIGEPQRLALVILAVVITGGGVCFWLARYLTRPLDELRSATKVLAAGDLSARVGRDLGTRKDEIGDLGRDFDRMAERLETLISTERQLLRDISHELRSPLARLNIALGIARQQAGPHVADSLGRIEHESDRLNQLIQEVLTLARLETGLAKSRDCEVDLALLLDQIVRDAQFEARSRNVRVYLVASPGCRTVGDPELLRRAVENVVRNAVSYTAPETEVQVRLHRRDTEAGPAAEILVRDHGKGVPDEALADLFRPFYRVESGRDRATGGVGLGLAITDRAVRAHGGTVTAANADDSDGGLMVTIRLPLGGQAPPQS